MSSSWQRPNVCIRFIFSDINSGDSAFYLLEMVAPISMESTLSQTRMGEGRVTLTSKGPMKGQYISFMANPKVFIGFLFSISISKD